MTIERYVAGQIEHHPMADSRVADRFRDYQFHDPAIDLTQPSRTSHALYWRNLQVVVVNDYRYRDIDRERLASRYRLVIGNAKKKEHWLSQVAMLPNHVHIVVRARLDQSPAEVTFGYVNNTAYAADLTAILK